jgi:branched-chain amino acid transport system substrate-binding protein
MPEERAVSRREFLRIAGIAGATIGVAGSLGGFVAACGESEETTTTAGAATTAGATTTGGATATTAGATTTVSAAAETGREIKVGCVVPKTGPLSVFAGPFDWVQEQWTKAVAGGVMAGDGKNHPIRIFTEDTQSATDRCAQVTGDLIQNTKVDVIFAGGAPETMNPAAEMCEAMETPGLMIQGPWQAFFLGRQKDPANPVPFKWGYALCVGIEAMVGCFIDMWDKIPTNKKVGLIYSNSEDGRAWSDTEHGGPFYFTKAGYTYTMPGLY